MTFSEELRIRRERINQMRKDLERTGMLESDDHCQIAAQELVDKGYRKEIEDVPDTNVGNKSEWISVKERLPENARVYLCRCVIDGNTDYPFFMVLHYILIDENPHFQHECDHGLKVTHWMPIPEPPKGAVE